jgi:MtN3 and saliva related transmembrane protein
MIVSKMLGAVLATLATICVVSSYIPQIVKGYKTKSLKDVSMGFLLIIIIGTLLWMIYAIVNSDFIFLTANSIILLFAITLTVMKLHYNKGKF